MTLAKVALRAACQVRIHCQHSTSCELTLLQTTRAGVNSAPEWEFIANSNSGIGIEIAVIGIGIELELP